MKQPKIETEKNIEFLKEEIKKSAIHAKDSYDYKKLCVKEMDYYLVVMKRTGKTYIFIIL